MVKLSCQTNLSNRNTSQQRAVEHVDCKRAVRLLAPLLWGPAVTRYTERSVASVYGQNLVTEMIVPLFVTATLASTVKDKAVLIGSYCVRPKKISIISCMLKYK